MMKDIPMLIEPPEPWPENPQDRTERRYIPAQTHTPQDDVRLYVATERNVRVPCKCGMGSRFYAGPVGVWRRDRRGDAG